jgi:predicted signal transduction protein with EAL and GGDEF domain
LQQADLVQTITDILVDAGLPPRRLELEITESAIIGDRTRALHLLRQIKALGVGIAMDDFGTGYSSLDTLQAFPFDKIKIDKSFVLKAVSNHQATAIVRAVLASGGASRYRSLPKGWRQRSSWPCWCAKAVRKRKGTITAGPGIETRTGTGRHRARLTGRNYLWRSV